MKKLLLGLTIIFPLQAFAADDSVYSWGAWSQGIQPAAGPAHTALPAPAQNPNVKFRPNENSVFSRTFVAPGPRQSAQVTITTSTNASTNPRIVAGRGIR